MTATPSADPAQPRRSAPLVVRAYAVSRRLWEALQVLLRGTFDGVWLGVMSRRTLYRLDDFHYWRAPRYYDEAHNLGGLRDWEVGPIERWFAGRKRLLVLAVGGGREVLALGARGYEVDGYECNPALVDVATRLLQREGAPGSVRLLARDALPTAERPYDGIIIGWSAYTLMPGRSQRVAYLRRLRAMVPAGAPLLLSFHSRTFTSRVFPITRAVANVFRVPLGRERVELGDTLGPNYVHFFTRDEITAELAAGGFAIQSYTPGGQHQLDPGVAVALAEEPAATATVSTGTAAASAPAG